MVMFLFTYVVPKFADLFNSLDAKLPAITVFMLAVGLNAQKYAPFCARSGLVLAVFLFWRWKKTDQRGRPHRPGDSEHCRCWATSG